MKNLTLICALFLILAILGGVFVPVGSTSTLPPLNPLDGIYRAKGVGPDGTEYTSTVIIEQRGESYFVQFAQPNVVVVVGIGHRFDDYLAVAWASGKLGCSHYKIEGRTLKGRWVMIGADGVGEETLRWSAPLNPDDEKPRNERKMRGAE